jgi:predicted metal-dependent phosphoesterase TrpH
LIDLHSHTTASDGTDSPAELVARAAAVGLEALAITDHDTFTGYEEALPYAKSANLELHCGIEISTRHLGKTIHLLGYFFNAPPTREFQDWVIFMQRTRRERNVKLIAKLQSLGLDIELDEVEGIGRSMTGRPHFALVLMKKGYVASVQEAFKVYLGDEASAHVERESVALAEAIRMVNGAGGLSVLAHPIRLGKRDHAQEEALIADLCRAGLRGIEVWHSDHRRSDCERYERYAHTYGLAMTGGSDFHGYVKPNIELGTGIAGNLSVPRSVLDALRQSAPHLRA